MVSFRVASTLCTRVHESLVVDVDADHAAWRVARLEHAEVHDEGRKRVDHAYLDPGASARELGQPPVEEGDARPADHGLAGRMELAPAVAERADAGREQRLDVAPVASRQGRQEALQRVPRRLLERVGRRPARAVVLRHPAAGAVVRDLDVRLVQVERGRGVGDGVVEDVAQEQHGALLRRQRLERQEEGERAAFEQVVSALRRRRLVGW